MVKFQNKKSQPCWNCKKYNGGCSWSKDFIPVNGWIAKPTVLLHTGTCKRKYETESYAIAFCPEFVRDIPRAKPKQEVKLNEYIYAELKKMKKQNALKAATLKGI